MKAAWLAAGLFVGASVVAYGAAQTKYIGTVFLADPTTLTNQLKINPDGSIATSSPTGTAGIAGVAEFSTAIGTTATPFGPTGGGAFSTLTIQAQGQAQCFTFNPAVTLQAPSGTTCPGGGGYLGAGQGLTYPPGSAPGSQGRAIAATTGGYLWETGK